LVLGFVAGGSGARIQACIWVLTQARIWAHIQARIWALPQARIWARLGVGVGAARVARLHTC
jgi:hypothetical protein